MGILSSNQLGLRYKSNCSTRWVCKTLFIFLYIKNVQVLPISLSEVFSLHCNLRFPSSRAFSLVQPILSTCLAALNPLTLLEIYHSINSLRANDNLDWTQFLRIFKVMTNI